MIRRFDRVELKYLVTLDEMAALRADIEQRAEPDPYSGTRGYDLVSLYYDSPNLDFYWDKIEGLRFRRKVRVRIYPADPITETKTAMVEIKQRIDRTLQKRRVRLPIDMAHALCGQAVLPDTPLDPLDEEVAQEVAYLSRSMDLRPTCITAYHRVAYQGTSWDPGLRITFDTHVRYRVTDLVVHAPAENRSIIPENLAILEIKVNGRLPDWVTSLVARHNLQLRRISKYCAGVSLARRDDVMHLAVHPAWIPQER